MFSWRSFSLFTHIFFRDLFSCACSTTDIYASHATIIIIADATEETNNTVQNIQQHSNLVEVMSNILLRISIATT